MTRRQFHCRASLAVAALLIMIFTTTSRGDDDGWVEIDDTPQQQKREWLVPPEQFDQWVFQNASSAEDQRKVFETKLALTIFQIDGVCQLTDEQRLTLQLAGELDINRYFSKYMQVKDYYLKNKPDQNNFNEVWQLIQPLQRIAQVGLFGEDSAVRKISRQMLEEEQQKRFREIEHQRREYRYRALVEMYVMMLDDAAPLSAEQRKRLVKLILENTRPPNVFGQTDQYYVMHQASLLSRKEVAEEIQGPLLEVVHSAFQLGRRYENFLEMQGAKPFIEEEK